MLDFWFLSIFFKSFLVPPCFITPLHPFFFIPHSLCVSFPPLLLSFLLSLLKFPSSFFFLFWTGIPQTVAERGDCLFLKMTLCSKDAGEKNSLTDSWCVLTDTPEVNPWDTVVQVVHLWDEECLHWILHRDIVLLSFSSFRLCMTEAWSPGELVWIWERLQYSK